jgi:hypothetical protein
MTTDLEDNAYWVAQELDYEERHGIKEVTPYYIESLDKTREDYIGYFLQILHKQDYSIKDWGDYLVVKSTHIRGVIALEELDEFAGKGVSGYRLFFDLDDFWDRYNRANVMLPAPVNKAQVNFVITTLNNLLLPETYKLIEDGDFKEITNYE